MYLSTGISFSKRSRLASTVKLLAQWNITLLMLLKMVPWYCYGLMPLVCFIYLFNGDTCLQYFQAYQVTLSFSSASFLCLCSDYSSVSCFWGYIFCPCLLRSHLSLDFSWLCAFGISVTSISNIQWSILKACKQHTPVWYEMYFIPEITLKYWLDRIDPPNFNADDIHL